MRSGRRFWVALGGSLTFWAMAGGAMAQPAEDGGGGAGGREAGRREAGDRSGGFYGWGPHIGVAGDPDQLVVGLHFDVGRIAQRVRFQPDLELGLGDNHTIFSFTLPAHYLFRTRTEIGPYLGGGVMIGLDDRDRPAPRDDTDVEIGIALTGGLEWRTEHGDRFFLELNLLAGDLHDFQAVGGITF
jgi:hypothetical protein